MMVSYRMLSYDAWQCVFSQVLRPNIMIVIILKVICDLFVVLYVAFQSTAMNVSEQDGTIAIVLVANGTSEFAYVVNLTLSDVTTGS